MSFGVTLKVESAGNNSDVRVHQAGGSEAGQEVHI
jgi:hypothetical protein